MNNKKKLINLYKKKDKLRIKSYKNMSQNKMNLINLMNKSLLRNKLKLIKMSYFKINLSIQKLIKKLIIL